MIFLRKVSKYFILFIIVNIVVETSGTVWDRTHNEKGLWDQFCRTPLVDSNAELTGSALFATNDMTVGVYDDLRQQWWPFAKWWPWAIVMTFPQLMTLEEWSFICNDLKSFATTTSSSTLIFWSKKNMLLRQKKGL